MAYYDSIEALKSALSTYSENEEKLSALYKTAIENAEKEYEASVKALDEQYQKDRNEVYSDTAQEERNLFTQLAHRGLGFSGEAAQAKLNSGIILANRLGALSDSRNASLAKLGQELADNKLDISFEEADKMGELLENRNSLGKDIASLELEKDISDSKIASDEKMNTEKLNAEKEINAAKLQAEKDMSDSKLQAEKEMHKDELYAKYYSAVSVSDGSNVNGGAGNTAEESTAEGYIPTVTAKELAKQLVTSATGGNSISGDKDEYLINKYLLTLKDSYDINSDYLNDLMFVLKAYGYEELTDTQMREKVITYEAKAYYNDSYDEYYDKYVTQGINEETARKQARSTALKLEMDYIYSHCNESVTLFRRYCSVIGISSDKVAEYLQSIELPDKTSGNSGLGNNYATRTEK